MFMLRWDLLSSRMEHHRWETMSVEVKLIFLINQDNKQPFLDYQLHLFTLLFFRQLQAHWDSLDRMERMHGNLCWRDKAALETGRQVEGVAVVDVAGSYHQGQWELLHEGERHD